ncbi:MAG: hypothetical protein JSV86_04660, partial [Gemmatimonadota bacterium]
MAKRPLPENQQEFEQLMEEVDQLLRDEGVPIPHREFRGIQEVSRILGVSQNPMFAKGEPTPGVYSGLDLTRRVKR